MALFGGTIWEVRAGGADTNGAGFNPSNPNMATDLATSAANTASPVATSASYTFTSNDVGAYLFIQGGGGTYRPGWYRIVSVSAGAATLDASVGAVVLYKGITLWNTVAGCVIVGASGVSGVWAIDYSQQNGTAVAVADAVTAVSTTVTSASAAFGVNHVGNLIYLQGGTGSLTAQWREVVTYVNATTITVDVSLSVSTGVTMNLGGALATPAQLFTNMVADNRGWIQKAAYTITTGLTTPTAAPVQYLTRVSGYNAIRGDGYLDENRPTIQAGATIGVLTAGNSGIHLEHLIFDGRNGTYSGVAGLNLNTSSYGSLYHVKILNMDDRGAFFTTYWTMDRCEVTNCGSASPDAAVSGIGLYTLTHCWIHDNPTVGVYSAQELVKVIGCLITGNVGSGLYLGNHSYTIEGNVFHGNGGHGLYLTAVYAANLGMVVRNNIFSSNTGYGVNLLTAPQGGWYDAAAIDHNAYWNNGSGERNNLTRGLDDVTLTEDPFNGASSQDFSLNARLGGGAACRGTGAPGLFPGGNTRGFVDIGGAQHADPPPNPAARLVGVIGG